MQFLRKKLILLIFVVLIYGAFFLTHYSSQPTKQILGVQNNLALFMQPLDGRDPMISAINASLKEIDVEVYLLSDSDIISSLRNACGRGVIVRLMLEPHPFGGGNVNETTQQELQGSCVQIKSTSQSFSLTHEKTIVIDGKEAFILNQNLTKSSFTNNREYDILDTNMQDVVDIKKIFDADWNRASVTIQNNNLVISPISSRTLLHSLILSAKQQLFIEMEVIDDPEIIRVIGEKAKQIPVHIIFPSFSQISTNKKSALRLSTSGVVIKTMSSPYIHAKLIIADNKAYVGSVNLTTQSMDSNREVGIIISQQDIVSLLLSDFSTDWEKARNIQ